MSRLFTLDSIRTVRDFTTRKTLERAHLLVSARLPEDEARDLSRQCLDLIARHVDRDAKAEAFHAAVKFAVKGERSLWDRLEKAPAAQDGGAP